MTARRLGAALALALAAWLGACGGEDEHPGSSGTAVVWAVGDGADGSPAARRVAARIGAGRVDRFLYLGDVYQSGTAAEFASNYQPVYGRLARRTAPTPGNHEWPNWKTGYAPYWRRALGRSQPLFYSFRLGGWQIVSVNSENPDDGEQLRWLRSEVAGPGDCRLAFWHRPRYSAGTRHGDDPSVAPLWNAVRGRVRLVVTGHEHGMQRLHPIDGVTSLISGAGGHGLYRLRRADRRLAWGEDRRYGALRLELSPGRARFAFVDADGRVLDQGEVPCRRGGR